MTLVLDLPRDDGPRLHAVVIGCGRFPHLPAHMQADRPACYDSAVEMVAFLAANADAFEPPLARIDCLLADPATPAGQIDVLPGSVTERVAAANPAAGAGLVAGPVDAPRQANVQKAFDDLLAACRPGDAVLVYGCSHGVAGRDETGLLVLEDVHSSPGNRWAQVLDMKYLASGLPAVTEASAVWVFMDACQEVIDDLKDTVGGANGFRPISYGAGQLARAKVKATALAAAHYGAATHAPPAGGVAYFTRALLDGIRACCVERIDGKWKSTAKELVYGLEKIARATGPQPITVSTLVTDTKEAALMRVAEPSIPVHISSVPSRTLDQAIEAYLLDGDARSNPKQEGREWRFRVPIEPRSYEVNVVSKLGTPVTLPLHVSPPAVFLEVRHP